LGMRHLLTDVDVERRRAVCCVCGPCGIRSGGYSPSTGRKTWRCRNKARASKKRDVAWLAARTAERAYRAAKADTCERCGFVPEHPCQLDVDHHDGDRLNSSSDNLVTLCANCHRLKTFNERQDREPSLL
jgi:hypothetical protein